MSLFNNFTTKVTTRSNRADDYSLDEILSILDMVNDGISKEEISQITGRSKDSLNYRVFEGQVKIKGKLTVRSVKRFWFVDPNSDKSAMRTTPEALKLLFIDHGQSFTSEADVQKRIAEYADLKENTSA